MEIQTTDKKVGRDVPALILSAYHEYTRNGYPRDPNVYVVTMSEDTWTELRPHSEALFFDGKEEDTPRLLGFRVEFSDRYNDGQVLFGPEQFLIVWKEFGWSK